jgi:hypothetical protein
MESKAMERNKTSHVAQIEAHVRLEAAQDLHDDLDRIRRNDNLYGFVPWEWHPDAFKNWKKLTPEDKDFEPHRYYGEGRNE